MNRFMRLGPYTTLTTSQGQRGLTLMEVLVTITILAVLTGLATPSFKSLFDRWRVQQAAAELTSTIYFARSEAIKRNSPITIQKNANSGTTCTNASTNQEWGCGWFIFDDLNGNGSQDTGEATLQTYTIPNGIDVIHSSGGANIKLDRWGKMSGFNAKGFTISPTRPGISSPATRSVCVSTGGRVRVTEDVPCT
jgi:type IV fimbrial biogenesis protein FimT